MSKLNLCFVIFIEFQVVVKVSLYSPCIAPVYPCIAPVYPCIAPVYPCIAPVNPCTAPVYLCIAPAYPCIALVNLAGFDVKYSDSLNP